MSVSTLILRTAGTNCDAELAFAFEQAGATTQTLHLSRLIEDPSLIARFDMIGFPGGFSYGDDIAAGRILANRLRHRLLEPLQDAVKRGVPMIGICNGFQVLVKLGLLPYPEVAKQAVTLGDNAAGRFMCRWVPMAASAQSCCIWTQGLGRFELPVANGEGRFTAPPELIQQLNDNGQVALRYDTSAETGADPGGDTAGGTIGGNPNGSDDAIAGICDPSGVVFGLMPHPERYTVATQHPQWTRQPKVFLDQPMPGLRFFENAVEHARANSPAAV
ncbi:phosphoribosylformylglycinamidine synthase subunit PurQ [Phycisphaeraceae bacterium D3-23]